MIQDARCQTPIAALAAKQDEVRDFLKVHLEDRGFSVELCHREEYLQSVLPYADVVICDAGQMHAIALVDERPAEIIALSDAPSDVEREAAERLGAIEYLGVPFVDTERLASALDAITARIIERLRERARDAQRELEPVG